MIRLPRAFPFLAFLPLAWLTPLPVSAADQAPRPATEESAATDEDAKADALPLPRFASLRNGEANVRVGPGKQYPMRWIYHRAGLPVEIIEQYEYWRKIRDPDGDTGWIHKSMLNGHRSAIVKGGVRLLLRQPETGAGIVLRAEPGVSGDLIACEAAWCRIQIHSRKGWLPKTQFFGAYPDEVFQ